MQISKVWQPLNYCQYMSLYIRSGSVISCKSVGGLGQDAVLLEKKLLFNEDERSWNRPCKGKKRSLLYFVNYAIFTFYKCN